MPIDITNKEEKQIALTGTQIEETLLQAHLSKDAIAKIEGLEASAREIDEGVSVSSESYSVGKIWEAPIQPPIRTDESSSLPLYENIFTATGNDIINRYEEFRNSNPTYIKRSVIGKDASNIYDIYKYIFEPENGYEKTLLLSTLTHGSEVSAAIALLRFLDEMINNTKSHSLLAYIRNKVRLIIVPNVNHWGSMQSPRKRTNSNQIDINRQYDYNWSIYPTSSIGSKNYKGISAFSESEAVAMRDNFFALHATEACGYLDFHNYGTNLHGENNIAPIVLPKEFPNLANDILALQTALKDSEDDFVSQSYSYNPSGYIYCQANYNIPSANPEWNDSETWGASYSSLSLRKQVSFYGNLIGLFARNEKLVLSSSKIGTDAYMLYWTQGATTIPTMSTATNIYVNELEFQIPNVNQAGYVKVQGVVTIKLSAGAATNIKVSPNLKQSSSVTFGVNDRTFNNDMKTTFFQNLGTVNNVNDYVCLPFVAMFPVLAVTGGVTIPKFSIVYSGGSSSTIQIMRYRAIVEYVRSDKGDAVSAYYSSAGHENEAIPMQLTYPLN